MRIHADETLNTAICPALILGCSPQPNVFARVARPRIDILDVTGAFRQKQPIQMRRALDEIPESVPPRVKIYPRLEDISHRRTEHARTRANPFRLSIPSQRLTPVVLAEEASRSVAAPQIHTDSPCPSLRVAVRACRR